MFLSVNCLVILVVFGSSPISKLAQNETISVLIIFNRSNLCHLRSFYMYLLCILCYLKIIVSDFFYLIPYSAVLKGKVYRNDFYKILQLEYNCNE